MLKWRKCSYKFRKIENFNRFKHFIDFSFILLFFWIFSPFFLFYLFLFHGFPFISIFSSIFHFFFGIRTFSCSPLLIISFISLSAAFMSLSVAFYLFRLIFTLYLFLPISIFSMLNFFRQFHIYY